MDTPFQYQINVPKRKFAAVEVPVRFDPAKPVHDTCNKLFGGEAAVKTATNTKHGNIELSLRPDDPYCHPIFSTKSSCSNVLLQVKVKRLKRKADGRVLQTTVKSVEALGVVNASFKFDGLADFQFLPPSRHFDPKLGNTKQIDADMEKVAQVACAAMPDANPSSQPAIDPQYKLFHMPPSVFAESDKPRRFLFKKRVVLKSSKHQALGSKGNARSDAASGPLVWAMGGNVPLKLPVDHPYALYFQENPAKQELLNLVKRLFDLRPAWKKHEILVQCESEAHSALDIHKAISLVAYRMVAGPWRGVYMRLGYDPTRNPNSRIYQILDFRINLDEFAFVNDTSKASSAEAGLLKSRKRKSDVVDREKPLPTETFTVCSIPLKNVNSIQLCDIKDDQLRHHLKKPVQAKKKCDPKSGWFVQRDFAFFRRLMKHRCIAVAKSTDPKEKELLEQGNAPIWQDEDWTDMELPEKYKHDAMFLETRTRKERKAPTSKGDPRSQAEDGDAGESKQEDVPKEVVGFEVYDEGDEDDEDEDEDGDTSHPYFVV